MYDRSRESVVGAESVERVFGVGEMHVVVVEVLCIIGRADCSGGCDSALAARRTAWAS